MKALGYSFDCVFYLYSSRQEEDLDQTQQEALPLSMTNLAVTLAWIEHCVSELYLASLVQPFPFPKSALTKLALLLGICFLSFAPFSVSTDRSIFGLFHSYQPPPFPREDSTT